MIRNIIINKIPQVRHIQNIAGSLIEDSNTATHKNKYTKNIKTQNIIIIMTIIAVIL